MLVVNSFSRWGIKDSSTDITNDILDILNNAESFIIVGGYNFTFKTAGYIFFDILRDKVANGVPVLMIIPSNLTGYNYDHTAVINFCISSGIGLILNGNNHSKWLFTENDLYYGSSNFTETSWKQRVEVISIHNLSLINRDWKKDTVNNFKNFILSEINLITRRPTMLSKGVLVSHTTSVWNSIKPKILKLNPSIEKVKYSLENYSEVEFILNDILSLWFRYYQKNDFKTVFKLSKKIINKLNKLCRFAYLNIYNEVNKEQFIHNEQIVNTYNILHAKFIDTIDKSIEVLNSKPVTTNDIYDLQIKNIELILNIEKVLLDNFGGELVPQPLQ